MSRYRKQWKEIKTAFFPNVAKVQFSINMTYQTLKETQKCILSLFHRGRDAAIHVEQDRMGHGTEFSEVLC